MSGNKSQNLNALHMGSVVLFKSKTFSGGEGVFLALIDREKNMYIETQLMNNEQIEIVKYLLSEMIARAEEEREFNRQRISSASDDRFGKPDEESVTKFRAWDEKLKKFITHARALLDIISEEFWV